MKFILGKKLEMTQIFKADGAVVPVTAVLATPNVVTQIKTADGGDGYSAVQVGWGLQKKIGKARAGHIKDLANIRTIKEFRVKESEAKQLKRGDQITVEAFVEGDEVRVTGISKGKGFQGVVKRHGFHGAPKSHGHKDQERMPGSIGAGGVQRVFKGKRMAGQMGNTQTTITGLEIVSIDTEKNILYVKGAIPGARNSEVMIYGPGEMTLKQENIKTPEQEIKIEVKESSEAAVEENQEKVKEEIKTE